MGLEVGVLMMDILQGRLEGESLRAVMTVSGVTSRRQAFPIMPPTTPFVVSLPKGFGGSPLPPCGEVAEASRLKDPLELRVDARSRVWLLLFWRLGLGDGALPVDSEESDCLFRCLLIPEADPHRPREKVFLGVSLSDSDSFDGEDVPRDSVLDLSTTSVTPLLMAPPMTPTALRPKVRDRSTACWTLLGDAAFFRSCSSGQSSEGSISDRRPHGTTSMSLRSHPPARVTL